MAINLTEIGWTDENGSLLGTWTNQSNVVSDDTAIIVAQDLTVNTLNGNDVINGDVNDSDNQSEGIRLDNYSQLNTNNGNDTITGTGFDGFFLSVSSSINTGSGNDAITGTGFADGISSRGTINTGIGNDTIIASADGIVFNSDGTPTEGFGSTGLANFAGTIDTGNGDDNIIASGRISSIDNDNGTINTGNGNDTIIANSEEDEFFDVAISNQSGTIDTGKGNDTIDALTGGFSDSDGSGLINLGQGDDLIRGFGDHQGNIDGGRGYDRAELGFDYDETLITFGSTNSTSIEITFDSATMSYTNIELFDFNGQTFSLESLQAMA
ncbi:MAG: hypothetical protein RLZZ535_1253 [Cyanobacteriota bacterium]